MHNKRIFLSLILLFAATLLLSACGSPQEGAVPSPPPAGQAIVDTPVDKEAVEAQFAAAHSELVEHAISSQKLQDEDVIRAFAAVPRHKFVPDEHIDLAYADHALPIGYGQTISQPSLVARMTEILELKPGDSVFEIGTGSGYQAAILAELDFVDVYTIEIVPELAVQAGLLLEELGYTNITPKWGDGYYGWEEYAPFDAIIVTAAPDHLPPPLAQQLADGGRMVIPIGPPGWYQTLWKFIRQGDELLAYNMGGVGFVPFTGAGVESAATTSP